MKKMILGALLVVIPPVASTFDFAMLDGGGSWQLVVAACCTFGGVALFAFGVNEKGVGK